MVWFARFSPPSWSCTDAVVCAKRLLHHETQQMMVLTFHELGKAPLLDSPQASGSPVLSGTLACVPETSRGQRSLPDLPGPLSQGQRVPFQPSCALPASVAASPALQRAVHHSQGRASSGRDQNVNVAALHQASCPRGCCRKSTGGHREGEEDGI